MKVSAYSVHMKNRPTRTLLIDGKLVTFLCDSGVDKTVIKDSTFEGNSTGEMIYVKLANGQVTPSQTSRSLHIVDPKTGARAKGTVIISPQCPINLLGRDRMVDLGISIILVEKGMVAVGKGEEIPNIGECL